MYVYDVFKIFSDRNFRLIFYLKRLSVEDSWCYLFKCLNVCILVDRFILFNIILFFFVYVKILNWNDIFFLFCKGSNIVILGRGKCKEFMVRYLCYGLDDVLVEGII